MKYLKTFMEAIYRDGMEINGSVIEIRRIFEETAPA